MNKMKPQNRSSALSRIPGKSPRPPQPTVLAGRSVVLRGRVRLGRAPAAGPRRQAAVRAERRAQASLTSFTAPPPALPFGPLVARDGIMITRTRGSLRRLKRVQTGFWKPPAFCRVPAVFLRLPPHLLSFSP